MAENIFNLKFEKIGENSQHFFCQNCSVFSFFKLIWLQPDELL